MTGSFFPFDAAKLDSLYPTHGRYVSKVAQAVSKLVLRRYIMAEDGVKYITDAAHSSVGR